MPLRNALLSNATMIGNYYLGNIRNEFVTVWHLTETILLPNSGATYFRISYKIENWVECIKESEHGFEETNIQKTNEALVTRDKLSRLIHCSVLS